MQRRIEFIATGCSALVGNFSSGDVWRGPQDHCTHLVEVHGCAKWADVQPVAADEPVIEQAVEAPPADDQPATPKKKGSKA